MVNPILLGSASPRRKELLSLLNIPFSVAIKEIAEDYPDNLKAEEIALFIANSKANAFTEERKTHTIITADTIVCLGDMVLGKPKDIEEAEIMLAELSGNVHQVYTAVAIADVNTTYCFCDCTYVYFKTLSPSMIKYYVHHYQPLDKAGSYGIQEWMGLVGIEKIEGSYSNVMGLPTEKLYQKLLDMSLIEIS